MLLSIIIVILKILSITIPLLLAVAYFTMGEQKIMEAIQRRLGPNVIGFIGLLQAYKLLILNTCLGLGIISLICLNFYKLALLIFMYLLIKNNSFIKEKFDDYLVQKGRFNKYYKKRFPILFYVLPIIGILSGLGMFYTGYIS